MATLRLPNSFAGRAVLITGGTQGIGLATGLAFGRLGAQVFVTQRWGSVDAREVEAQFERAGAPPPIILDADASRSDDTEAALNLIARTHRALEVFVSNVSFAPVIKQLDDYTLRGFNRSMEYGAWPMVEYVQACRRVLGHYPRYVMGLSCDGPDTYYPGYDFVAAAKSAAEVLCRYMARHLFSAGTRVNILRSRPVSTASYRATFGAELEPFLRRHRGDEYFVTAEEVANTIVALCSGWLDAMTGQVVTLDGGVAFSDNLMELFERRTSLGLT